MNKFLLHPKATLAVIITGCATIDTLCAGIASAVQPLSGVHGLERVAPTIQVMCLVLGAVSNVALAMAGVGRSFVSTIDNLHEMDNAVKRAEDDDAPKPAQ